MPRPVSPARRSRPRPIAIAGLVLAFAATGCGAGGLPATAQPSAAVTVAPTPRATPQPAVTVTPGVWTPAAELLGPPAATLAGIVSGAGLGEVGSFTWDGAGTDAPWIVPADGSVATPGSTLEVAFEPAALAASWTVRWAPVTAAGAGDVASGTHGSGGVAVVTPREAGPWTLQLEASFGSGRSGTWYWRIEVAP